MKTIFKILLVSLFFALIAMGLISCERNQKAFTIILFNHNLPYTTIDCDSVNMVSDKQLEYYVNGSKMTIFAEQITIESN